jgi:hypothetical protein|tara:strand:- start:233 stop:526 length:294 start_codon:yes stop_codon:yes gene_type:complete
MSRPYTKVDQLKNGRTLAKQVDASNKELTQDILIKLDETNRDEISGKFYTVKRNVIVKDWIDAKELKSLVDAKTYNKVVRKVTYNSLTFKDKLRKVA